MVRKIVFYFLSLWLLFVLIFIITADIPICLCKDSSFVEIRYFFLHTIIPLCSIVALLLGGYAYFKFLHITKGTKELSFEIKEIESIEYEHLTFLTTYIIPLVCFNFGSLRYIVVFVILLFVIGCIYIRTDIFYANPSLALLNFRIYKVNGLFRNGEMRENRILITRDKLDSGDNVKYLKLDERIYYALKIK